MPGPPSGGEPRGPATAPPARRPQAALRRTVQLTALAALAAVVFLAFSPGTFTPDALDICNQALTGLIGDWHTPILAWAWGVIGVGPTGVYLATVSVFVAAVYAVLIPSIGRTPALAATAIVVLAPTTLSWLGAQSKDVWFAAALLVALAAFLHAGRTNDKRLRIGLASLGAVAAWWAVAARPNGIVPVFAMLVFVLPVQVLVDRVRSGRFATRPLLAATLVRSAAALLIVAGILLSQAVLERMVVHPIEQNPDQPTYIFDLTALSIRTGTMLLPEGWVLPDTTVDDLAEHFDVREGSALIFAADSPVRMGAWRNGDDPSAAVDRLQAAWADAVLAHPIDYAAHRLAYTRSMLGLSGPYHPSDLTPTMQTADQFGLTCHVPDRAHPALYEVARGWTSLADRSRVVRAWWFVLLLALGLAAGWRRPGAAALAAAGLASIGTYVVFGVSTTFRYSWFTAICALMVCAIAATAARDRWRGSRTREITPGAARPGPLRRAGVG